VLLVRCGIYSKAKKWDAVVTIAETVVKIAPKERHGWIQRSFALHEMKRTQKAFDKLLPAVKLFPKFWLIPYNLACYTAQLGRIEEAERWFKRAMVLNEKRSNGLHRMTRTWNRCGKGCRGVHGGERLDY